MTPPVSTTLDRLAHVFFAFVEEGALLVVFGAFLRSDDITFCPVIVVGIGHHDFVFFHLRMALFLSGVLVCLSLDTKDSLKAHVHHGRT